MFKNKKNKLFVFFLLFFFLIGTDFVLGEGTLPDAPGTLQGYIKYIYNLLLAIGGLLAFGILIYAGFRYLTSVGSPARIADAKDQIFAAFLGLIILLSSYLILYTIDPQLVILKPPGIKPPPAVEPPVFVPPEERVHTYQEIPVGILISRVLEKRKLDEIKEISEETKLSSEELKKLTEDLKALTAQCVCANTTPNATTCDYHQLSCPATKCLGDPCPNRGAINAKIAEINSKIKELESYLNEAEKARNGLIERLIHLQTGENYLSGLEWEKGCHKIIGHDLMVWESERHPKIEIINLFPEFIPGTEEIPLINRDILNFYCRI